MQRKFFRKKKAEKGGRSRKKGISVFEQIKNLFIYLFSSRLVLEFADTVEYNREIVRLISIDFEISEFLNKNENRYVITELLQSDLHKIIVSPQHLSPDHIKVFLYQILRGKWKRFSIVYLCCMCITFK